MLRYPDVGSDVCNFLNFLYRIIFAAIVNKNKLYFFMVFFCDIFNDRKQIRIIMDDIVSLIKQGNDN